MTVLTLALKGALVLSLAGVAVHLLRRAPAAARHAVWVAAFVALLALPLLTAFGPSLELAVLPDQFAQATPPTPEAPVAISEAPLAPAPVLAPVGAPMLMDAPAPSAAPMPPAPPVAPEPLPAPEVVPLAPALAPVAPTRSGLLPSIAQMRPAGWLLTAWAGGALLALVGWMIPLLAAVLLVRHARPETSSTWLNALEHARLLSDVEGPVRLLRSDRLDVPVAWGWGTPAVVLPADADEWDADRRQAVLLHELAHLARGDAQTQVLAQVAVSLHWFDPLAWWAYGQMLAEREHACDDAVLRGGARPSAYAGHLVDIARGLRRRSTALTGFAPMARHSRLEGRVRSILSDHQRAALSRLRVAGVALGALALTLPLAACTLTSRTTETPAPPPPPPAPAAPVAPSVTTVALQDAERELAEAVEALEAVDLEADLADLDIEIDDFDVDVEAAMGQARRQLAEARRQYAGIDVDWGEIENDLAEAEVDVEEALEEARAALAEVNWERTVEEALREAKIELKVAMEDLQLELADVAEEHYEEAAERELLRLREGRLRDADRERNRARQARQRAAERARRLMEEERREYERRREEDQRQNERRSETANYRGPSAPPGFSFSIAQRDGRTVVAASRSAGAWAEGLASWRVGLESITDQVEDANNERQIANLRRTLSGMENGLNGLERDGRGWAQSSTEHRIVAEGISEARAALADAAHQLDKAESCEPTN